MKFEDYLKMENAEAHLQVVLANVAQANETLSLIFQNIEEANQSLKVASLKVDDAYAVLDQLNQSKVEIEKAIDTRLKELARREAAVSEREVSADERDIERQLETKDHESLIDKLKSDIRDLLDEHSRTLALNEITHTAHDDLLAAINKLELVFNKLQHDANVLEANIKATREANDRQLVAANRKLLEVDALVVEAEARANNAGKPLEEREATIRAKEANLHIYQQRLVELFAFYFPGVGAPRL